MKKTILMTLLIVFCLALAGTGYAVTLLNDTHSTIFGGGTYKPSTGVTLSALASATSYCASSQHKSALASNSGLQYATISSSPAMPSAAATATGAPTDCTTTTQVPTGFPTQ